MSGFQSNNLDAIKNVADSVRQIMQGSMEQQRELPDSFVSRVPQAHTDIQDASTIEKPQRHTEKRLFQLNLQSSSKSKF